MGYCIIVWMGYYILASVWMSSEQWYQSTKAVNSTGTTVELTCPLPVSAQGYFFRRLVLWCYICAEFYYITAPVCMGYNYIAFGFFAFTAIMIKPTFGVGERNTDVGGARSRLLSVCAASCFP
jgi:hypothetical protein